MNKKIFPNVPEQEQPSQIQPIQITPKNQKRKEDLKK